MKKMRFIITPAPWCGDFYLRCAVLSEDGSLAIAQPVEFKTYPPEEIRRETSMLAICGPDAAQNLMDELWKHGIRPSDIGSPGHLEATKTHLSDMRKLVEKSLDVKL